MALDQGRGVRHPFTTGMVRRRVAAELAAIRDFSADAVVIGSNLTMLLSARIAGVPISMRARMRTRRRIFRRSLQPASSRRRDGCGLWRGCFRISQLLLRVWRVSMGSRFLAVLLICSVPT